MFESKSGILLIGGLGFFLFAFLSNAIVPILMYRHLPEKTCRSRRSTRTCSTSSRI